MRRRRNADAPAAADAAANPSDFPAPVAPLPPAGGKDSPETAADVPAAPTAEATVTETGEETPKPRRRTAARRKTPVIETVDEVPVAAAENIVAAESAAPEHIEAPAVLVPETPAPKAPRRRRAAAATPPVEAPAVPASEELAPAAVPEAAVEPIADSPSIEAEGESTTTPAKTGRRRGLTRRAATVVTEEVPAVAVPSPEEVPAEVSVGTAEEVVDAEAVLVAETDAPTAESPAEEPRSRRNRGGRRRRADVAAEALVEEPATEDETSAVPAAETTAEATGEETTESRRRLRGPRLQRTARGATTAAAAGAQAATPLAPVEPLPPQYQPLPDDVLARLPETRVVVRKNVPDLTVNGESRLPLWFFVNTEEALFGDDPAAREVAQREIRLAYEAGVRSFSVLAHLPWRMRSGERRFGPLDDALQFIAENAPDALILPRLIFSPPSSWERAHADQMTQYPNGETGDVSFGSRLFWEGEADEALRAAVEHVAQGDFAGRVFGFFLEHGEWLHEKGRGYDVSEANTQGFRGWLRARYRSSQVALRAAWYDGEVTFENAVIPPVLPPLAAGTGAAPLFFSDREQRYVDFHEYASDVIAGVILRLGKAVKEASGGRSAVVVSYGYTLELSRANSGHLALGQVLASPNVDILTGPVSYSGRTPGGSAPLPSPVDSITLAGKLWVSEDDTKTYLAHSDTPDVWNTKISSLEGTWAAYTRNFGTALTRGAGVSWMDSWGMGWLDDRELWQRLGRLHSLADTLATRRRNPRTRAVPEPDVAVIVDERSFFDLRADESVLSHLVAQQRDALLRSGARIGFYLLSDLLKKNFPDGPRLLLFLNAFRLPDALRAVIRDRFQDSGRTLAWLYGPGCRETNLGELTDVIGMQLRLQPWGSKVGTQPLPNARSPLAEALRGQRLGEEVRLNPSYYVADPKATPLGEYVANGNTALAYRKHARWQSVFVGEMELTIPLLRGLYRLAGVPVFTVDDDVATVGESLLSLHSAPGGGTTVYLPEEGVLYDLLSDETLATDGWGARLSMPPRGTRLLFWGSPAEVSRLGGDPRNGPPGLTTAELQPKPMAFVFEGGGNGRGASSSEERFASDADVSPEDDALMQAALAGELPGVPALPALDDVDDEALTSTDSTASPDASPSSDGSDASGDAAKKKRRRRRRGRGRAGAESEGEGGEESATDTEEEDELGEDTTDDAPPVDELPLFGGSAETVTGADDSEESDPSEPAPAEISAEAPTIRSRPTLDELLPNSAEVAEGVDLPPIPEEFLPLESPPVATSEAVPPPIEPPAPRRRRGITRRAPRADETAAGEPAAGDAGMDGSVD